MCFRQLRYFFCSCCCCCANRFTQEHLQNFLLNHRNIYKNFTPRNVCKNYSVRRIFNEHLLSTIQQQILRLILWYATKQLIQAIKGFNIICISASAASFFLKRLSGRSFSFSHEIELLNSNENHLFYFYTNERELPV